MTPDNITISGPLVRHLRSGVKREIGTSLAILGVEVETPALDAETYSAALTRFLSATALFVLIGLADRHDQPDIEIDLQRWSHLLLKALETQHEREVMRLQDAAADGIDLPARDVPALGALVADIRRRTGAPRRRKHPLTFLERHRERGRLLRRRRGSE